MSGRGSSLTGLVFIGLGVAIVVNATSGRHGRHPAPIAVTQPTLQAVPTPVPRPDQGAQVALGSAPLQFPPSLKVQPKSRDQLLVEDIQQELSADKVYDGPIDGLIGPKTRDAIMAYQKGKGLTPDGQPDRALLDHIRFNRRIAEIVAAPPPETISRPVSQVSGAEDDAARQVRLVQRGLAELGYSPGPVDGMMGQQTRDAIRKFQQDRQIDETGEVTPDLLRELRKVTGVSVLNAV